MNGTFTQDHAQRMWDVLCVNRYSAVLSFSYHERMMPSETYQVSVPLFGRLSATRLHEAMELAHGCGCDVHLIGQALLFLPRADT